MTKTISGKTSAWPYIRERKDFITKSNNFWAKTYEDGYFIFSYRTCIAQYSDGVWYINDATYSGETTQQMKQIMWALGPKFLRDNAIHVNYGIRGIQDLRLYVTGKVALQRVERIKKQGIEPGDSPYYKQYVSWTGKIDEKYSYV